MAAHTTDAPGPAPAALAPRTTAGWLAPGALIATAVATIVRLVLATRVPLFPDETYYWDWSRHLAAGYFDHPLGVAVLIRAGTALLGDTRLGVRLGVIVAGAIATLALARLAQRLAPPVSGAVHAAGTRAAVLAGCVPIALVGFVLATPDAPLLAAMALTLLALDHALAAPASSRAALGWWCAAGVALGVAFCSKYTAVLVPAGVFAALLSRRTLRRRLAEPGPYAAAAIALLLFAPVVAWNAAHDWVSFAFQLRHGLGAPRGSATRRELDLLGGQVGLASPIVAVLAGWSVVRALRGQQAGPATAEGALQDPTRGDRAYVLAVVAAAVAALFAYSALRKPVEANWPAPALVAALPLLAAWPMRAALRRWRTGGIWLAAILSAIVTAHALWHVLPIPPRRDPVLKSAGWDQLAAGITRRVQDGTAAAPGACAHVAIAANRYQDASELAYHLSGHPRVLSLNVGGRPNQYDLWTTLPAVVRDAPGTCLALVIDPGVDPRTTPGMPLAYFSSVHPLGTVTRAHDGATLGTRAVWLLDPRR